MKFDPWTFIFQVVNFVVLLLVLKRLLYKPVREIMEKRRALAAQAMDEAERARQEAEELKAQHLVELKELKERRLQLEEEMQAEVARERRRMLDEAAREAEGAIEKEKALFDAEKKRYGSEMRGMAIGTVELFATEICRDLADRELHRALLRKLMGEIDEIAARLAEAAPGSGDFDVEVLSAFPLGEEEERALRDAFAAGGDRRGKVGTSVDDDLLAGMRIKGGGMVYDASLGGQVAALAARLKESTDGTGSNLP